MVFKLIPAASSPSGSEKDAEVPSGFSADRADESSRRVMDLVEKLYGIIY